MARLTYPDGRSESRFEPIALQVAQLGAQLRHLPVPEDADTAELLARPELGEDERATLLARIDGHLAQWLPPGGHAARDLVEFHADLAGLAELREKFRRIHSHPDDEVRYILSGTGYFGLVQPDGTQVLLEVGAGDFINVPHRTEHWFTLGNDPRLKAVRYFSSEHEWRAEYSQRSIDPALAVV